jgi:hypothetical protein
VISNPFIGFVLFMNTWILMLVKSPVLVVLLTGPTSANGKGTEPAAMDPGHEVTVGRSGARHTIPPDTA